MHCFDKVAVLSIITAYLHSPYLKSWCGFIEDFGNIGLDLVLRHGASLSLNEIPGREKKGGLERNYLNSVRQNVS